MFDKDFSISGKHAGYWKDLCELRGNVKDADQHSNFKIFNAYIDAYMVCPIIGYQYGRKATIDKSTDETAGMLTEIIIKKNKELKYIYQILMLVDEESEPDVDKRIYRAFNLSEKTEDDKKFIAENMKIFHQYFLGGLEVLHEQFVEACEDEDDYLKKMFDFVRQFNEEQDGDALQANIDKFLNK